MPQLTAQMLAELLERHGAALKLYARQWCRSADDVVQQAFIDLAACSQFPENAAAWLFAAVRRRAISQDRSDHRRQRHEAAAAVEWFKRSKQQQAAAELAVETLAELPLADREIVIAHLWGRLTFEEIGGLVGTSPSTAQRRFEAAINRLREKMNSERQIIPCPNQRN